MTASGCGWNRVVLLLDLERQGDLGAGRRRGGLGVGDDLHGEARLRRRRPSTGSAFRPAGRPLILTVTGSLNVPLRTIFPLSSTVAPALTSTPGAASSTRGGPHDGQRHGGQGDGPLGAGELALGLQGEVDRPEGRLERRLDADLPLGRLVGDRRRRRSVTPGGKGSGGDRQCAVGPLGADHLDRDRRAEAVGDLDRRGRRRRASRASARAGAATRPYSVIEQVGRFVCWAKTTGLDASRSIGPLAPCPRPTSLIGAAGNAASAAAESVSTPAVWPAAIVPGRTVSPAGGSATVTVIGPL